MTRSLHAEFPTTVILNNHSVAAYTLDQPPSEGPHYAPMDTATISKYGQCIVFWDPFASNSMYTQTEITKEMVLQDSSLHCIERRTYWGAEYLVLARDIHGSIPEEIQMIYKKR